MPISYTGSGTEDGIFSITAYRLELVTIKGYFYDHEGTYPDTLVGLEFQSTYTWGSACAECYWDPAGTNIGSASSDYTVTIPNNEQMVSWEQSTSADGAVLMGITITLDTGTVLELGTIGPVKQDIQYLGGPIHGVKWTYNEVLTSV